LKKLRERFQELQNTEKEYERIKAKIEIKMGQIDDLKLEISEIETEALKLLPSPTPEAKARKLEELSSKIEELNLVISYLQNENGRVKGRISEIEEYMRLLENSTECPVCKSSLTPEHRDRVGREFETEKDELKRRLMEILIEIGGITEEKRKVEKEYNEVNALDIERLEKIKEDLKKLEEELEELKKRKEEIKPVIKELESIKKEIITIEKELEKLKTDYERHISSKNALEKERSKDEIETELNDLKTKLNKICERISSLLSELECIPEEPEENLRRLRELKEKYEVLKSKAEKVDKIIEELNTVKEKLEKAFQEKESTEKELALLGYSEEEYRKVGDEYNNLIKKVSELKTRLESTNKQIDTKIKELSEINESIKALEDKLKSLEKILEFVGKLQRIRQSFSKDGIQRIVRQRVAPIISEFARDYIENFNLDIMDVCVNEDFDVSIMKQGGEISIKSISGGEKIAVAIALRLAIAKALAGRISTIIMDEPTTHLDEERRRELVGIMKNFFREGGGVPQMIIITHHRELEDVADTVYRVEKVDGISKVVEITSDWV